MCSVPVVRVEEVGFLEGAVCEGHFDVGPQGALARLGDEGGEVVVAGVDELARVLVESVEEAVVGVEARVDDGDGDPVPG